MTLQQQFLTILIAIIALQLCRWIAFWCFPAHRPIPDYIQYLGKVLPSATFGLLVVYCYKNVDIFAQYHGIAEFLSGLLVIILHLWRKNMFLSIAAGTIFYMYLVQKVFVVA